MEIFFCTSFLFLFAKYGICDYSKYVSMSIWFLFCFMCVRNSITVLSVTPNIFVFDVCGMVCLIQCNDWLYLMWYILLLINREIVDLVRYTLSLLLWSMIYKFFKAEVGVWRWLANSGRTNVWEDCLYSLMCGKWRGSVSRVWKAFVKE